MICKAELGLQDCDVARCSLDGYAVERSGNRGVCCSVRGFEVGPYRAALAVDSMLALRARSYV